MEAVQSTSKSRPPLPVVAAMKVIGASPLSASEKAVLRAMLQWWNHKTGQLWPSVGTLAEATGYTPRGVRKILRRLEACGAILMVVPSRGGRPGDVSRRTHLYSIDLPRISSMTAEAGGTREGPVEAAPPVLVALKAEPPELAAVEPEAEPPVEEPLANPEPSVVVSRLSLVPAEPRTEAPGTAGVENAEPGPSEHTTHEHTTETVPAEHALREVMRKLDGWVDAEDNDPRALRAALSIAGVRGPNLERLSRCPGLTTADVQRAVREIQNDRGARNVPAILVARLSKQYGVELQKRPTLDARAVKCIAEIEAMRRRLRTQPTEDAA
jgi:hypothetical protein